MIVPMQRVRVLAARADLPALLAALQDAGTVHPLPAAEPLHRQPLDRRLERLRGQLARALGGVEATLAALAPWQPGRRPATTAMATLPLPQAVRAAGRYRRRAAALVARRDELLAERDLLARLRPLLAGFERLAGGGERRLAGHLVLLRSEAAGSLAALRAALEEAAGPELELRAHPLPGGEVAVLVLVPAAAAPRLADLLAQARVEEVHLPPGYGDGLLAALPRMRRRRAELPGEIHAVERELRDLAARAWHELAALRARLHDRLETLAVLPLVGVTGRAVVVEGWVPAAAAPRLAGELARRCDGRVAVELLASEAWEHAEPPVVLANPRLFRPFEALVRPLPLPRYGTLDPTPFVAVFFPLFFGVMLGDLAYGALLALGAWLLGRGAAEGSLRHNVARIGGACAAFTLVFGALYGELLGDLGRRAFGLRPLLFDREEAVLPALVLAIGIGFVHLLVGLVAGALAALRSDRRRALGRGLEALLLVLVATTLLAALRVLPRGVLGPATVALLVAFPALLLVEGLVAPVELLATLGRVLSYARIMAIGTASVMLAVVANRLAGAFGSVLVGGVFALLFHLVNFALGVFSPAVHALRLHYVELFGACYSPGGLRYRPLAHWRPAAAS